MRKALLLLVLIAAIAVPPAAAAVGPLFATQGGAGALSPDGTSRYVAVGAGGHTALEVIRTRSGAVGNWRGLDGSWGIPTVGTRSDVGLSRNGRTLVLGNTFPSGQSSLLLVDTKTLGVKKRISLPGVYSVDALSPDASRLFLVQYVHGQLDHYVVRAYDLRAGRLLPGRIADRTQRSWVMQGTAVTRTVSPDGRWVYTLYTNPGGYPFVHALDTMRSTAHCVGLPLLDQSKIGTMALRLDGGMLHVGWKDGTPFRDIDTTTWRLSLPAARHASASPWLVVAALLAVLALAYGLRWRKRINPSGRSIPSPERAKPA